MTAMAIVNAPGNFAIMALAAKPAFDEVGHLYIIAAGAHLEYFRVAYVAGKTEAMKPVGENDRSHALLLGPVVNDHIGVLRLRRRHEKRHAKHQGWQQSLK